VRRSPALTTRWGTSRDKNALRHLIQNGVIDMIIMAIDYKANPELFEEAIEATQLGISLVPMGHQGRKFHIRKFRSMYHNAEQPGKAVWATEFDTRITRVGYFLRSTHLDELPQAFNMTSTTLNISHSRWIF
jgi:hypothetical protein